MGQNNRQRRAAKQRQRTNRQRSSTTSGPPPSAEMPPLADLAAFALTEAVRLRADGRSVEDCVNPQLVDIWRDAPSAVERAADAMAVGTADALFKSGWAPVDLHETARRQLDSLASATCSTSLLQRPTGTQSSASIPGGSPNSPASMPPCGGISDVRI